MSPVRSRSSARLFGVLLSVSGTLACQEEVQLDPTERYPGGETTNDLLLGNNAFKPAVSNISEENALLFFSGNSFFSSPWVEAPSSTTARDGLGPLFNARACSACHPHDGRASPPRADEEFLGLLLRVGTGKLGAHGAPEPDPTYGGQLQNFSIPSVEREGTPRVRYSIKRGSYEDGEEYELLDPEYWIDALGYGPFVDDFRISPRIGPQMIGLGLLEAISEERLAELADPEDEDGDGISGRVNRVWSEEEQRMTVGRFGWKAEQPTVRQQVAGAFLDDLGLTSDIFSGPPCTSVQLDCLDATTGGEPEIQTMVLDRVELYSMMLAVPIRTRWEDEKTLRGKQLFFSIGCENCHVSQHVTGASKFDELENQVIWPYTDLLLHDMGEELSDHRPSFEAEGNEWRTPPLWGIGRIPDVNKHDRLLHDGRARGVAEAILWHGGEGAAARDEFKALPKADRDLIVRFVESL